MSFDCLRARKAMGLTKRRSGLVVGKHDRSRAVGNQRAIGAAQRGCDIGVLVGDRVAEIEAEILVHVGVGVGHPVRMVLRGDHGQLRGAVTIALKIGLGDATEQAGKAALYIGFLLAVAGAEQDIADLGGRCGGHFLGTDDQRDAPTTGFDEVHGAVERCGARGAGVFKAASPARNQAPHCPWRPARPGNPVWKCHYS